MARSSWAALLVPHSYLTGFTSGGLFFMGCTSGAPFLLDGIHFWWPVLHGLHFKCPFLHDGIHFWWLVLHGPHFWCPHLYMTGSTSGGLLIMGHTSGTSSLRDCQPRLTGLSAVRMRKPPRSVSIPAPVHYTNLVCSRGLPHMSPHGLQFDNTASSTRGVSPFDLNNWRITFKIINKFIGSLAVPRVCLPSRVDLSSWVPHIVDPPSRVPHIVALPSLISHLADLSSWVPHIVAPPSQFPLLVDLFSWAPHIVDPRSALVIIPRRFRISRTYPHGFHILWTYLGDSYILWPDASWVSPPTLYLFLFIYLF